METIGTLCHWLSRCKGTDNNGPDQIIFDFFAKRSFAWMCLLSLA